MARRYYSSTAVETTLAGSISNSATSITVTALSGFPNTTPFTCIIDADTASEELVEVTNVSGTTLTVTRGVDGTAAVSHNAGATFRHGVSARDFDEANDHVNDSTGVHGLGGSSSVVGTTDTQTLTNKTINIASNTLTGVAPTASPTFTGVASFPDGTVSAPAITNTGDTNTGIYFPNADEVAIAAGGVNAATFTSSGITNFTFSPSASLAGVVSTPAGAIDQAMQFAAEESVLRNLPARVHPAEALLKQAVWWIDSAHSSASGQAVTNLGWGGSALNAQLGSTGSADSNDPKYLDWTGENYVYMPGVASNQMTVPDEAALDITGDIDIRVKVAMDDWTPAAEQTFIAKGGLTTDAYALAINANGQLRLYWGNGTGFNKFSTVGVSISDGATKWVRATLDVDNGASGNDVKFYTSDDGVTWTQLGTTVTTAGTTSIGAGTTVVRVGSYNGSTLMLAGKVYRAQVLNGINGTPVLDIDCSAVASGAATSFTARTGQTVTINRSTTGRKAVAVTHPCWLLGTDDYLEVPDNDLIDFGASDSFTVLVVARLFNWDTQPLATKTDSFATATDHGYNLYTISTPALVSYIKDGSVAVNDQSNAGAVGALTSFASVRNTATDRLGAYVNGSVVADVADTTTASLESSAAFRIGRQGTAYAAMEFIAAAIFRRALTASEITTLTNYYAGRVGA